MQDSNFTEMTAFTVKNKVIWLGFLQTCNTVRRIGSGVWGKGFWSETVRAGRSLTLRKWEDRDHPFLIPQL